MKCRSANTRAAFSRKPGACFDSFMLSSLLAYAHGCSIPLSLTWDRQAPKCIAEASQVSMNSLSKSTAARQGLEISAFCNALKKCSAGVGKGPFVYPEFFFTNSLRSALRVQKNFDCSTEK